jgi:hypothetical protein
LKIYCVFSFYFIYSIKPIPEWRTSSASLRMKSKAVCFSSTPAFLLEQHYSTLFQIFFQFYQLVK